MTILASLLSSIWSPETKPAASSPAPSASIPPTSTAPPPPSPVRQRRELVPDPADPQHPPPPHSMFTARSGKQLSLFLAGAAFLGLTTAVTRRSVTRKIRSAMPKTFTPSYLGEGFGKVESAEGTLFALEALSLATLNTMSFGIMAAGGTAWAFDISSMDDLKARAMRHRRGGATGETDQDAEDTIEDWMASVLGKAEDTKEERDTKEWMAKLLEKAKDKKDEVVEGKKE